MAMQHHLKDAINVSVISMAMNNWVFVTLILVNVIVNITLKETIVSFAKKDSLEIQSNYYVLFNLIEYRSKLYFIVCFFVIRKKNLYLIKISIS